MTPGSMARKTITAMVLSARMIRTSQANRSIIGVTRPMLECRSDAKGHGAVRSIGPWSNHARRFPAQRCSAEISRKVREAIGDGGDYRLALVQACVCQKGSSGALIFSPAARAGYWTEGQCSVSDT